MNRRCLRAVALAALACVSGGPVSAQGSDLTLDASFERVLAGHPDLRVLAWREQSLSAAREIAGQAPALRVGVDVENVLGTGELSGVSGMELGLSLASVFERGDKREARLALADRERDALALQREGRRLDLLAEVARRYLDLVAAREALAIAQADVGQREQTVAAAQRRVRAGASPKSVELSAQATLLRARLAVTQAGAAQGTAWRRLAVLWGDADPGALPATAGDPSQLPVVPTLAQLQRQVQDTPMLRQFADEQRVREARLRLAQSQRRVDWDWQVGVRRLQSEDDWALMAGISVPLGSARRAEPAIRAASAELEALAVEREGSEMALQATLVEAHGRYTDAFATVAGYRDDILPALAQAADAAADAFRAGALSHLEWAQLQSDIVAARREQLSAAIAANQALIEIQRLTAQPFVLPTTSTSENPS